MIVAVTETADPKRAVIYANLKNLRNIKYELEELAATRLNEVKTECTCKSECGCKCTESKDELTEDDLKSALDDLKKICREIFK